MLSGSPGWHDRPDALLLILGAFASVGVLFLVGMRTRPELEIPPKPWPPYEPTTRERDRRWVIAMMAGWAGLGVFAVATGFNLRYLADAGIGVWVVSLGIRLYLSFSRRRAAGRRAAS